MSEKKSPDDKPTQGARAQALLSRLFTDVGWRIREPSERNGTVPRPDLVVSRPGMSYAIEVKFASEGRSDRLVPLWSQAHLQASRAAESGETPLAVVAAPRIPARVADQVLRFAAEYAPGAAAGVIDFNGLRRFRGEFLNGLDADGSRQQRTVSSMTRQPTNIFSDLNQWLLKVLVAPELPSSLLSAPRDRYRSASDLAHAANVSVMTASRLVHQLQQDGYLDESKDYLRLVRREALFRRWQSSSAWRAKEVRFRFLMREHPKTQLQRILKDGEGCLALFAAAEELNVGFVHGVPPHIYVERLGAGAASTLRQLVPVEGNEAPDVIIRQAPARQSVFRGAVEREGILVCDILQVWLDVSSHPTRGKEQADYIERRVLGNLISGGRA